MEWVSLDLLLCWVMRIRIFFLSLELFGVSTIPKLFVWQRQTTPPLPPHKLVSTQQNNHFSSQKRSQRVPQPFAC